MNYSSYRSCIFGVLFMLCSPCAASVSWSQSLFVRDSCEGVSYTVMGFCDLQMPCDVACSSDLDIIAQIACAEIPYSCRVSNTLTFYMGCFA